MKKNILKTLAVSALVSCGVLNLVGCNDKGSSAAGPVSSEETPVSVIPTSEPAPSSSAQQAGATSATVTVTDQGKGKDGFDAYIKPNDSVNVKVEFNAGAVVDAADIAWITSSKTILGVTAASDGKTAVIKAKAEGDAQVTVKVYNKDGSEVVSNAIKFRIEGDHKKNSDFPKANATYMAGGVEKTLTIDTLYRNSNAPHMNSLGGAHVMVIPFGFQDAKYQSKQNAANIEKIKTVFFGDEEDIKAQGGWQSLKSFYVNSSYGKSQFDGFVPENWCIYNGNTESLGGGVAASTYARNWYISEYDKANHGALGADAKPLTWFDSDGDGFIDLIWIVYSHETIQDTDWWAYVTYTGTGSNKSQPNVKTLGWASIDWTNEGLGGIDPHTFIHETGHTYGLPDYYDYNNIWSPMGGIDFMDHNVGDHNMYSKYQLGWTAPYVVDDDAIITLRPGSTTGDCFIIPSPGYNGTPFDEYMMVELMAPVGVAEYDYKNGNGFTKPGVRILHVDGRAYTNNRDTWIKENVQNAKYVRVDNSYGGRSGLYADSDYWPVYDKSGKEIKQRYMTELAIMESSFTEDKNWQTSKSYTVDNKALFTAGSTFTLNSNKGWASTFMPSGTNLWNKAKTFTGWKGDHKSQTGITIDETCTFNYEIKVLSIDEDPTYGWTARVQVKPNAY